MAGEPYTPPTEFYVSPDGLFTNAGTEESPKDLEHALDSGKNIYMLDGIYTIDRMEIREGATVKSATGARPIVTSLDGTPPTVHIGSGARLENVWIGGTRDTSASAVITLGNNVEIVGCTFFGYYGGIAEGGNVNNLYQSNRFVSCGGGVYAHDIYLSETESYARVFDNIFIGGEGYKVHNWHMAENTTALRNFFGAYWFAIVINHASQVVEDNVIWNHVAPATSLGTVNLGAGQFIHNLFGHKTFGTGKWDTQMNGGADDLGLTVDRCGTIGDRYLDTTTWEPLQVWVGPYNGEGHVLPASGTNHTHYDLEDLPDLLGYSEEQIDAAVAALIASFQQDLEDIHDDETIEANFAILRDVVNAWKVAG